MCGVLCNGPVFIYVLEWRKEAIQTSKTLVKVGQQSVNN